MLTFRHNRVSSKMTGGKLRAFKWNKRFLAWPRGQRSGVSGGTIAFCWVSMIHLLNPLNDLWAGTTTEGRLPFVSGKAGSGMGHRLLHVGSDSVQPFEVHIYRISSRSWAYLILAIPRVIREEKEALKTGTEILYSPL